MNRNSRTRIMPMNADRAGQEFSIAIAAPPTTFQGNGNLALYPRISALIRVKRLASTHGPAR